MASPITQEELFDPQFLDSLNGLRLIASRVPRGGRFAEQRSQDLGSGTDFRDFRAYSPGDEFRSIDWNIYQRLGRVFLRLYEELEDLPLYLMPDISQSMFQEETPRAFAGLRATLAVASISLNQHDTVSLIPFSNDAQLVLKSTSGRTQLPRVAECLADLTAGGDTDLPTSLARLQSMKLRKGLLVIVSDFFDPQGVEAITDALRMVRHRLLLIQLTRPTDRDPDIEGDVRLIDCETGTAEDVTISSGVIERYRAAYDAFQESLATCLEQRQSGLLRLDVEKDLVSQLATLFENRGYAV